MEAEERFEVEYCYYKYNSGAADNGYYRRRIEKDSAKEAVAFAKRINQNAGIREGKEEDIRTEEEHESDDRLQSELIPWDGHFTGARALHVISRPIPQDSLQPPAP